VFVYVLNDLADLSKRYGVDLMEIQAKTQSDYSDFYDFSDKFKY
jgi:hypothetical protein